MGNGTIPPLLTAVDELVDDVAPYAIDLVAKSDYGVDRHRVADTDLQRVFVDMLRWYATWVEPTVDPAEVVDVLLCGTEFER